MIRVLSEATYFTLHGIWEKLTIIQILKTGFFHADPHPGNLAIDLDGSLIFYDFGMMGDIKSFTRDRLLQLFYAVYEKDARKVYHLTSL